MEVAQHWLRTARKTPQRRARLGDRQRRGGKARERRHRAVETQRVLLGQLVDEQPPRLADVHRDFAGHQQRQPGLRAVAHLTTNRSQAERYAGIGNTKRCVRYIEQLVGRARGIYLVGVEARERRIRQMWDHSRLVQGDDAERGCAEIVESHNRATMV